VAPVLNSVVPNSGLQGTNVAVTLNGSNFQPGVTIAIGGTGVSASNVKLVSSGQITATFNITAAAAIGAYSVTVTTGAGSSGSQPFTVTAPVPAKPTLTSLSPNRASRGAKVNVTILGTNFTSPATVAVDGGGVTVSKIVVVSSTKITATFAVSSSVSRRSRNTTVMTQSGSSNVLPFTVQ
jgi:hypothetical protein